MAGQVTRGSRFLAAALAFALAVVSSATCFAAVVQMPDPQQHACCAGMNQECGDSMAVQKDCCAVQSADIARLASAAQFIAVPALVVIGSHVAQPALVASVSLGAAFDPGAPKPSSSPTYLLVSVFRI